MSIKKHQDYRRQAIPQIQGFRDGQNYFEAIFDNYPELIMIFSMKSDFGQISGLENEKSDFHKDHDYQLLSDSLGIDRNRIVFVDQIHGSEIITVEKELHGQFKGDAIISGKTGYFPSIRTADCQAVLVIDPVRKVTAAIHAGWRGTVQRITRKVILELKEKYGTAPSDLIAALGPSVGTCCYEVDNNVLEPFKKSVPLASQFIEEIHISDPSTGKERISRRIDLRKTNKQELIETGVRPNNIRDLNLCTQCNNELFYSYRRDGANPGRLIALAGFRD